jgi:hypothetical protein
MKGNDKELTPMTDPTYQIKSKRLSQSWRKHVRRMKQTARKTGTAYTPSRRVVSISQPPARP